MYPYIIRRDRPETSELDVQMRQGSIYRCLYLASLSCLTLGSKVLCKPNSVSLTASLAPIIGFKTAIGTARTTERTGPCV
jgi:hypothetical protein